MTGRSPNSGARSTFNPTTNQINETSVEIGVAPAAVGNPDLRAEKGKELEMGFEAGLFNERLGLEVTYFNKRTTDQILSLPVAASLGIVTITAGASPSPSRAPVRCARMAWASSTVRAASRCGV